MNKKNKILIIFIAIIFIILIIFSLNSKKEIKKIENKETINQSVIENNENIINLKWNIENPIIKKESISYLINKTSINNEYIQKVVNIFGFSNEPVVNTGNILMFTKENDTIDINTDTNTVKFSKDLLSKPLENNIAILNEEIIKSKLIEFINNNFILDKRISVEINRINYESVYGPRFVTSSKNESNIISFTMNYKVDNLPVYSENGQPIEIKTDLSGNILKFTLNTPFEIIKEDKKYNLKNFDEIKNTPLNKFNLFDIYGGKNFDTSSEDEIIKESNITSLNSCYIFNNQDNILHPYFIFEGNTVLPFSGAVITKIILPAQSEK